MKLVSTVMVAVAVMAGTAAAQFGHVGGGPADDTRLTDIIDFEVTQNPNGVHVRFTSSGDFKATSYDLKRSDAEITPDNFETDPGEIVGTFLHVGDPGDGQSADIVMALPGGTSHFAVRAKDDHGVTMGYSNEDTLTVVADTTPPAVIANLRVTGSGGPIRLAWNPPLPGDDAVEIRISCGTSQNSNSWTPIQAFNGQYWGPVSLLEVSFNEVLGLTSGVDYYFVAEARDAALNVSARSAATTATARINAGAGGGGDSETSGGGCSQAARGLGALAFFATALALLTRRP